MDLFGVLYIPNFLLVILVILISLYIYGRRTFGIFAEYGVPGPKPTAYFGNLLQFGNVNLCEKLFKWKEVYGDLYAIFFGYQPHLMISDPEVIGEIMVKSFSNFTNRTLAITFEQYTANMIPATKDDHWKYLRTVLAPTFSSKKMREMVPLIEDVLKIFEKNLSKIANTKGELDVNPLFAGYTMDVIASTGFGIQVDSQENPDSPVVKNSQNIFNNDFFNIVQMLYMVFPMMITMVSKIKPIWFLGKLGYFVGFCKELVKERKSDENMSARKDLLQLMLNAQLEGHEEWEEKKKEEIKLENITDWRTKRGLTDVEIIAQCMIFFLAGYETTANTLSFFAHTLATNPDVQEKLCQEIKEKLGQESPNYDNVQKLTYLDMCMDETLRMYPIAVALSRETKEDCIIKGIRIPKNTGVMFPVMCLHYDPRYWSDPEKFDPERFSEENKAKQTPFTYLPFGAGPRICVGLRLAELEFKMVVVQMVRKFRLIAGDKTEKKIEFAPGGLLKAKDGIWIKIEYR